MIGYIEVTPVCLKFWQLFISNIAIGRYAKGTLQYQLLINYVRERANQIVLQLERSTPPDYVLPEAIDKITGEPHGPRGMIRSLAAALGVIDARNGLIPPNWGHVVNQIQTHEPQLDNPHANSHVLKQQTYGWRTVSNPN